MPYVFVDSPHDRALLDRFGAELRRCRWQAGMNQGQVGELAGISQSTVSRLEHGQAPGVSALTLVRMSEAMRGRFPLGFCPHPHHCAFQRIRVEERPPSTAVKAPRDLSWLLLAPSADE
jgi:transcriptional regulator with XRE-family HTH domain